jgi:hypothetical protein
MAVSIKDVFWDFVPCSTVSNQCFGERTVSGTGTKSQKISLIDTAMKASQKTVFFKPY